MAVRDNRIAAESIGIPRHPLPPAGLRHLRRPGGAAGTLYAMNFSTVTATKFDFNTSILILVFVVLGGLGNIWGSIVAAALLTVLPELLRSMNDYRMLIYAILLIAMMIFNNSGPEKTDPGKTRGGPRRKGGSETWKGGRPEMEKNKAMLEVTNLGISFGGLRAVDELSMKIDQGSLVGLIGPNGAGKTTVFNMLTGVYRPTDGGIRLDGQNLVGKKPHEICRLGVA